MLIVDGGAGVGQDVFLSTDNLGKIGWFDGRCWWGKANELMSSISVAVGLSE